MYALKRILNSKKAIYAGVPVLANLLAVLLGFDPTHISILVLDAFFAVLLLIQGILDIIYGSASDGTLQPRPAPIQIYGTLEKQETKLGDG